MAEQRKSSSSCDSGWGLGELLAAVVVRATGLGVAIRSVDGASRSPMNAAADTGDGRSAQSEADESLELLSVEKRLLASESEYKSTSLAARLVNRGAKLVMLLWDVLVTPAEIGWWG